MFELLMLIEIFNLYPSIWLREERKLNNKYGINRNDLFYGIYVIPLL